MARLTFRLLDSGPGTPAENMATDEVLLRGAYARPTLRCYAWDPPAISLGYFQRSCDAPEADLPVVRRLTGGGAILHRDELTYSVAAPLLFFGPGVKASYLRVVGAVRAGIEGLGVACDPAPEADLAPPAQPPFLCYERRSAFDVLYRGKKLVGSAQRREGRRILQHGSIPLGVEPNAAGATTLALAARRAVPYAAVVFALASAFREELDVDLEPAPLDRAEIEAVRSLADERYAAASWTGLR
jgi:lipoate-protein ligase A